MANSLGKRPMANGKSRVVHSSASMKRLALLLLAACCAHGQATLRDSVHQYVRAHEPEILRDYAALLAIPNVASDRQNIQRNADRIVELLRARGVEARLLETPGAPPLVYGEIKVPG